jgi:hypothetical protein
LAAFQQMRFYYLHAVGRIDRDSCCLQFVGLAEESIFQLMYLLDAGAAARSMGLPIHRAGLFPPWTWSCLMIKLELVKVED